MNQEVEIGACRMDGWMDGGLSNKKKRKKKRKWQVLLFFISSFSLACSTDALFRNREQ